MSLSLDPNKKFPQREDHKVPDSVDPNKKLAHLTSPSGAVKVIKAEGEFGDKVALACFSISNFGIFSSSEKGVGLFVEGGQLAAQFNGGIEVTGNCNITGSLHSTGNYACDGDLVVGGDIQLSGQDYAEDFDIVDIETAHPGTVMVLDESGGVKVSDRPYDKRVAGVVSGAGDYKPAVILGRQSGRRNRLPLALMGKVYCRVDASETPIVVGDLLTTSSTPGYAMKATNPLEAFGAVIGKALKPLASGRGLVPILVALQ